MATPINIDVHLRGIEVCHWLTDVRLAVVCGGRDFFPEPEHETALRDILRAYAPREVFHGAATGADRWGGIVARDMRIRVREFPAAWNAYGKGAGPIRNEAMATVAAFGICIAFPGNRGTANMVECGRQGNMYIIDLRGED